MKIVLFAFVSLLIFSNVIIQASNNGSNGFEKMAARVGIGFSVYHLLGFATRKLYPDQSYVSKKISKISNPIIAVLIAGIPNSSFSMILKAGGCLGFLAWMHNNRRQTFTHNQTVNSTTTIHHNQYVIFVDPNNIPKELLSWLQANQNQQRLNQQQSVLPDHPHHADGFNEHGAWLQELKNLIKKYWSSIYSSLLIL